MNVEEALFEEYWAGDIGITGKLHGPNSIAKNAYLAGLNVAKLEIDRLNKVIETMENDNALESAGR